MNLDNDKREKKSKMHVMLKVTEHLIQEPMRTCSQKDPSYHCNMITIFLQL